MCFDDIYLGIMVLEMFEVDFKFECYVCVVLVKGIVFCEQYKDFVSCDIFKVQLVDIEEDYVYWLE